MTSVVLLKNKKSGKIYAYVNEKVYDGSKGKEVYKRKCVGHLDPYTGEIIPNREKREKPPVGLIDGSGIDVIEIISKEIGLRESLIAAFPESWSFISKVVTVCLFGGNVLSAIKQNNLPSSRVMSMLFRSMKKENIDSFFRVWGKINSGGGHIRMILSSYDTYDTRNLSANVDAGMFSGPQMSESEVIYSLSSNFPVYYKHHHVPFSVSDEYLSDMEVNEWVQDEDVSCVFGVTYGDDEDMEKIRSLGTGYTVRIRTDAEMYGRIVSEYGKELMGGSTEYRVGVSHRTVTRTVNGKREYIHIFFDPAVAEMSGAIFLSQIERYRSELENGHLLREHMGFYREFFLISKGSIEFNSEAIMKKTSNAGFDIIVSNREKDAKEALRSMKVRDGAERTFDNLSNDADLMAFKLYMQKNLEYRYFIQFLVLIVRSAIWSRIEGTGITVDDALDALNDIKRVKDPWKKGTDEVQLTDMQKRIVNLLQG